MATYRDIDTRQFISSVGTINSLTDEDAINRSIMNILSTIPGERLFFPEFGSGLYNLLFEPMDEDTVDAIESEIELSLTQWENRINILQIIVNPDIDRNAYRVEIGYNVLGVGRTARFIANVRRLIED